jgi:opacity protein-like surface antigen
MRNGMAGVMVMVAMLAAAPDAVQAQTIFGGVGVASLWDDETLLGRGPLVSGGVAWPLGRHAVVEGELAWARHVRDSGYLAVEGTPLVGTARFAWLFQGPESRARVFASAGVGVVHSTGTLTMRSVIPGPDGRPVDGPSERRDWSLTQPSFELGTGVSIRTGQRVSIRPEVRWTTTAADPSARSTLEPPIWIIRAGVTLEWRMRR